MCVALALWVLVFGLLMQRVFAQEKPQTMRQFCGLEMKPYPCPPSWPYCGYEITSPCPSWWLRDDKNKPREEKRDLPDLLRRHR